MRYKGYYFDEETGFYYCKSRYYVPEWCRWLNADSPAYLKPYSATGNNLFAYCENNPVMYVDESGNSVSAAFLLSLVIIGASALVGGLLGAQKTDPFTPNMSFVFPSSDEPLSQSEFQQNELDKKATQNELDKREKNKNIAIGALTGAFVGSMGCIMVGMGISWLKLVDMAYAFYAMGVVGGLISSTGLTVFGIALDAPSDDPNDAPDLYQPPQNTPYTHPAYK